MSKAQYIVVEHSGLIGEHDVAKFPVLSAAFAWVERTYTPDERNPASERCLHVAVCLEEDGARRYDI